MADLGSALGSQLQQRQRRDEGMSDWSCPGGAGTGKLLFYRIYEPEDSQQTGTEQRLLVGTTSSCFMLVKPSYHESSMLCPRHLKPYSWSTKHFLDWLLLTCLAFLFVYQLILGKLCDLHDNSYTAYQ